MTGGCDSSRIAMRSSRALVVKVVEGCGRQGRRRRGGCRCRRPALGVRRCSWWLGDAVKGNGMRRSDGGWRSFDGNREQREIESKEEQEEVRQISAVKEALHVSTAPSMPLCREDEQKRIVEFCKQCVEQEKAGSLYVCGCPGTGKSLSMENVKKSLAVWAKETGGELPKVLTISCTSLSTTSEIFTKILEKTQPHKKVNNRSTPLRQIQQLYSQKQQSSGTKMMLVIADELDYLITKGRVVLHDLFMLTTLPFSKVILIAAPHHQVLEGPVEAPTSSNSVVANPATDSSPVSTGLDTPPDPEIHRGPLTLSQLCKHSTGENFSVLVFKTQRLFVTVPGTRLMLPLSPNPLNGLDFRTRSANISLAPEFMFAK
ncbi:hypothetical protein LXL04_038611 [Taraxacum kok-saghyz]